MDKQRVTALHHAQLYGHLINRTDRLYYPGGDRPVCSEQIGHEMVRAGWLVHRGGRYEITAMGLKILSAQQQVAQAEINAVR